MKYTLKDIAGAGYTFDVAGTRIDFSGDVAITKSSIYSIINATINVVMYKVNEYSDLSVPTPTRIDLTSVDLTGMNDTDELIFIFDLPLQKDVQVTNEVGVQINNPQILSELENLNDTLLEMMSELRFLSAIRGTLNSIRSEIVNSITIASGTITAVTTVTTVSTVSNISSIGGINAQPIVGTLQNLLVANAITSNISFS